jgi:hypothetical protein
MRHQELPPVVDTCPSIEICVIDECETGNISPTDTKVRTGDSTPRSDRAAMKLHSDKLGFILWRQRIKNVLSIAAVVTTIFMLCGFVAWYAAMPMLVKRGLEESPVVPDFVLSNITEDTIQVHMTSQFDQPSPMRVRIDPFVLTYGTPQEEFGSLGMAGFELGAGPVSTDYRHQFVVKNGAALGEFGNRVRFPCVNVLTDRRFAASVQTQRAQ